ncbi:DUF937 domain-containing protein [Hymenobacter convexus]|uniref:DUF937 domain-containing protein n=1 Tax=Hymenobacter sp. CA1UV-4 TaxID=3063782 RepID=UPI0027126541|nr:DUF937 domain-containing protein [Hymenobacter sp. CA1UV-4]MDO7853435.1 DUF937 domain-containing protein [Hymenobacter sp. CA1UV-4]
MPNVLDIVKAAFSRELVRHVASRLGEAESSVGRAVGGIVPMVLCGLVNQSGSGASQAVFNLSRQAWLGTHYNVNTTTGVLGVLGSGFASGNSLVQGHDVLEKLFGTGSRVLVEPISAFAGIRAESADTLLKLVGTVLPALMGQYAASRRLQASGLASELAAIKGPVRAMLPAGLQGLVGLLWLGGLATGLKPTTAPPRTLTSVVRERVGSTVEWTVRRSSMLVVLVGGMVMLCFVLAGTAAGNEAPVRPAAVQLPATAVSLEMEADAGPRPLATKELGLF